MSSPLSAPAPVHAALGAGLGVAVLALLASALHEPLLIAPLGASAALVFAAPHGPLASPRAVIGGHVLAAAVGLLLAPIGTSPLAPGLAVGLATLAMLRTRTLHFPAGATALVALHTDLGRAFVLTPVLVGTLALTLTAAAWHALHGRS